MESSRNSVALIAKRVLHSKMNFLAHVFLSGSNIPLSVGNLIADRIKGNRYTNYDPIIQKGIVLHREIDAFTDSHPYFKKSTTLLFPKYRHYSRVIIDMFYDHFLAVNWSEFHQTPLNVFSQDFYNVLQQYSNEFPEDIQRLLYYLVRDDWFMAYQSIEGLDGILKKMATRTRFESKMDMASKDLEIHYVQLQENFFIFMPDLITFVKSKIN